MWCIPDVTPEFIKRMEHILELYEKPYTPEEPIICFDEKSKQLIKDTRETNNTKGIKRRDYEYERGGTRNMFVTVEPKGGFRTVKVTKKRKKDDFAKEIRRIINLKRYRKAKKIHIVLDIREKKHKESSKESNSTTLPSMPHGLIWQK
jgi:triosephosphate isomerase